MLVLLSPSKTMSAAMNASGTPPLFSKASETVHAALNDHLRDTPLYEFYRCSQEKAAAVAALWQAFPTAPAGPAIECYDGLVFKTLDWATLDDAARTFGGTHLRLFSGLYGLLRPFDAIRPYRLDWSDPLRINGRSLATFWCEHILPHLAEAPLLINLASKEYSAPWSKTLPCETIHFKERTPEGRLRAKATSSKQARGAMARAICQKRPERLQDLFDLSPCGFRYDHSNGCDHVFIK